MTEPASPQPNLPPQPEDFRWRALFQRSVDPLVLLSRGRRFLFVNQAWTELTRLPLAEVRGQTCVRRAPVSRDPWDVIVRSLCCPPPEVLAGRPGRTRRLVPGTEAGRRWWDVEF